jgi:hypothetical protein
MPLTSVSVARAFAVACLFTSLACQAQSATPLINTVQTVSTNTAPAPLAHTFPITAAGTYQINLTDIGAGLPQAAAPLASVKLAISAPDSSLVTLTAVNDSSVDANTPHTQLTAAGSATFVVAANAVGNYTIHVVGAPTTDSNGNALPNSGPVSTQVVNKATSAQIDGFTGVLSLPPTGVLNNVGALSDTFTVATTGSYTVTLTDMQMPLALANTTALILPEGGSPLTDNTLATTAGGAMSATQTITLTANTPYAIIAGGQSNTANGTPNAGLYGISVAPVGNSTPVYSKSVPVGIVSSVATPALTSTNYTLSLTDLTFPNMLSQVGVAVTLNGQSVAQLTSTGTSPTFTAANTSYQVFAVGVPNSGSQGSYTLVLQPASGPAVLNLSRAVSDPTSGVFAYSYDTTVSAQTYAVDLADFGYPGSFSSLQLAVIQAGAQIDKQGGLKVVSGTPSATENITPAAGPVTLLVFATPGSANSGGLFGLDLTPNGAGGPSFETSQGVGALFSVQKVTIPTDGSYQVVVKDLGFPASFANLGVIVTRGTSKIGSVFGTQSLTFTASSGDYLINFLAQPTTTDKAGTYAMAVQQAPPAATLTLSANPTTVTSGATTMLTWTTTNTSSCSATSSPSGVWSGTVVTSGSFTTPALTANTTFTLTCVGLDGSSQNQKVTVNVTPASSGGGGGGGGGGGSIQTDVLAVLLGLLVLRAFPVRNRQ